MKVLKITLMVFIVLVIMLGVGLFVFVKTLDLNRYKDQISQSMSQAINRPVSLGKMDLSLSLLKGIRLRVQGMEIQDIPEFSQGSFFKVGKLLLDVDVLSLLKERKIVVSQVGVLSPAITLIRDKTGKMNIPVPPEEKPQPGSPAPAAGPQGQPSPQKDVSLPQFLVRSITIEHGECRFIDRSQTPEQEYDLKDLDVIVENLSLSEPFDLKINAAIWSAKDNLDVHGKIQVDLKGKQIRVSDFETSLDLSAFSLEEMSKAVPQIKDMLVSESLKGELKIQISDLTAGETGLKAVALNGELQQGQLTLKTFPLPIKNIQVRFQATEKEIQVTPASLNIGEDVLSGKILISDYLKDPKFQVQMDAPQISIGPAAAALALPVSMEGQLAMTARITAAGKSPDTVMQSLSGDGNVSATQCRLNDFNLLKVIFGKIPMLPNVIGIFESSLPEEYRDIFSRDDTLLEKVNSDFKILGDTLSHTTQVASQAVVLEAQGQVDFKQNTILNATVFIPKDLSQSMAQSVPELQGLILEDGRITIPLTPYQGKLAELKVFPDLEYLGKRLIVSQGKEQIQKLLEGFLGKEEQPAQNPEQQNPQGQETPQEPEQQLLEGVMDSIFKQK